MSSAVDWLTEKLRVDFGISFSNNILEQAKEMEKEQIIESYSAGVMSEFDLSIKTGEQYYNEIIKKQ